MNGNAGNNIFREKLQLRAAACSPVQLRQALAGFWLRGWLCSHRAMIRKASTVFVKIFFRKQAKGCEGLRKQQHEFWCRLSTRGNRLYNRRAGVKRVEIRNEVRETKN